MKAFVFDRYSQPLHPVDYPEPTVGEHEVLVHVEASSVNQLDVKILGGEFRQLLPYNLPHALGHDVAGSVISVGSKVTKFTPGEKVYARVAQEHVGTFAERVKVAESDMARQPASISSLEAASLPLVALTSWQALVVRGNVTAGQKVLIHAGAGGVGSIAIQIARHLGAHVATTSSAANADFVRGLGAQEVIDYRTQDFTEELSGYDYVLDSLGADSVARSLQVLKPGGKAIGISGPPDPAYARESKLNPLLRLGIAGISRKIRKQAQALGVSYEFLFMQPHGEQLQHITRLVDDGIIRPVIGKVFPFGETPEALAALAKGGLRGKVVIDHS